MPFVVRSKGKSNLYSREKNDITAAVSARLARVLLFLLMLGLIATGATAQTSYTTSPETPVVFCNTYQSPNLELMCSSIAVKDATGALIGYAQFTFIIDPNGSALTGTITLQNTSLATIFSLRSFICRPTLPSIPAIPAGRSST